ncbi:PREDICTED: uncharacterized protein LOC107185771 [Dufourea novaeangliae]|uniref:uncharacterized protein LOC107185771 n=1 Tax=Dufourea novaeangliae TaxID=178035 RepID=UPI00076714E2|nr:PREDICTED: uncharacterized protein LOC107185771 [Dufourea novaeangliae]
MFWYNQSYFSQLMRSYKILKLFDIYDPHSFIREYILDNVYIGLLMHIIFYVAVWFATTVIRKLEKFNMEKQKILDENRGRREEVAVLKNKKTEYQDTVIKEVQKMETKVAEIMEKIAELNKNIEKYESAGRSFESSAGDVADRKAELLSPATEGCVSWFKILEPSFPPPQPPPRKYGIFVSRPPGQRRPPPSAASATLPPKIGLK